MVTGGRDGGGVQANILAKCKVWGVGVVVGAEVGDALDLYRNYIVRAGEKF